MSSFLRFSALLIAGVTFQACLGQTSPDGLPDEGGAGGDTAAPDEGGGTGGELDRIGTGGDVADGGAVGVGASPGVGGDLGSGGIPVVVARPDVGVLFDTSCKDNPCGANASCQQKSEHVLCECDPGFRGDGLACENINECDEGFARCHEDASCVDTNGSYACSCDTGVGDGFFCVEDVCADQCGTGTCVASAEGFTCDCPLGTGGVDCSIDCSGPLSFETKLEQEIRAYINKPVEEGAIYASDLDTYEWLYADLEGITDLSGLECWPTLRGIDLGSRDDEPRVTDISPLAGLSRLEMALLDCSEITDLTPLTHKPRLNWLVLENYSDCRSTVPLTDLSPLANLTALTSLQLGGRPLGSLAPLSGLSRLDDLVVTAAGVSDVSALSSLTQLERLILTDNNIADLSQLGSLPHLDDLWLSANPLTNLAALENHERLRKLRMIDAGLTDISGLSQLTQLTDLSIWANDIVDVTPLAGMTRIGSLFLSQNQIEDLTPLSDNPDFGFLGSLNATSNPLDCGLLEEAQATLSARGMNVNVGDICP